MRRTALVVAALLGSSVSAAAHERGPARLLGEHLVPAGVQVSGTTVGGLSGIDRDPRTGQYVLISDDRSEHGPARFYTANIDAQGVRLIAAHPLRRMDGQTYPARCEHACDDLGPVNPEAIRFDPRSGAITWAQEGVHPLNPSIRRARPDGGYLDQLPLPENERFSSTPGIGPRGNQTLESLSYTMGGALIASALEGPLGQDGAVPTPTQGALTRMTLQTRGGHVLAQYAYALDPLFATPTGPPGRIGGLTGVAEILAVSATRFLVLQRSYATGHGYDIRVYEIDTLGATDVKDIPALAGHAVRPVRKKLLVDLRGLAALDNFEGMTWGPRLSAGERSLLLVSDNNFSATEPSRVIALALPPR
ncbi:esterase-like activity of phytase family protein [Allokutzneria sp. A3M-2-11 16]|uniref:esterase-like activity of phytase family protein n=1 Tax=Allokutzneria sp. A3M-2-11 16 TaxID=2962043 RepID=UPI0027E21BBC|nr:esterase-like activity of phytase family protein [Allokutzneria sp. A3M-2-11 16]